MQGTIFPSVSDQSPNPYWTFDDKWSQYVQVQRSPGTISGSTINFNVNAFDPNLFMRSKAYIKLSVNIQKQERNPADGVVTASNYDVNDRIYRKPGLVLANSCTDVSLRLNNHTMQYKDLRYIQNKLDTSFAGKKISDMYFSTSGGSFEDLDGVYNQFGNINTITPESQDVDTILFGPFGFDTGVGNNTIEYVSASRQLEFQNGGGAAVDLINTQGFEPGDFIELATTETFVVIGTLNANVLLVTRTDAAGNMATQDMDAADFVQRLKATSFQGDRGRQHSYDDAFKDLNIGATDSTFNYVEPLSFGPWNHLSDYDSNELFKGSWNCAQSPLIPYIRQINLAMSFKDIAANSLIYAYGRSNTPGTDLECQLTDQSILSAELVLFWTKPRDELLFQVPKTVRIQSWMYEHFETALPALDGTATLTNQQQTTATNNNIYTSQQPTYLLYYAMVDKDGPSYLCRAINTDSNGIRDDATISIDVNSVETHCHPSIVNDTESSLQIRSNTLGGDDLFDQRYGVRELYRITLKNSISDFPYNQTKFVGSTPAQSMLATYPSKFYFLLGEAELNSFFIRKGKLQTSNVMNFTADMVASDGYSISKFIQQEAFNGGEKQYATHIFYIYDRFFIELQEDGTVDSRFDAKFF